MWRQKRALRGLDDDIRDHIERETEEGVARGMTPEEARRQALVKFGNVGLVREDVRRVWIWCWMEQTWQDARQTWQGLRRTPRLALAVILTFAVGLGANTALFAAVNAVLLRPLPYRDPGALVWMDATPLTLNLESLAAASRDHLPSLIDLAGFEGPEPGTLAHRGVSEQVDVASVTPNFFSLLGVLPAVGRVLDLADASTAAPAVVVLSHDYWVQRFGGDPQVHGSTLTVDEAVATVVGVTARGFRFPATRGFTATGLPAETQPDVIGIARGQSHVNVIGRLTPGATPQQAAMDLLDVHKREGQRRGNTQRLLDRMELVATPLQTKLVGEVGQRLLLAMGAAALLLLITCVNIANLLLTRAATRQRELAVRAALGARPSQLIRLLLTESLLLAVVGLVCGLVVAFWALAGIRAVLVDRIAFVDALTIDWRVLAMSIAIAVCTGIACGLLALPGVNVRSLAASARDSQGLPAPGRMRLRRALLSAEVGLTLILLITAVLLGRTFWSLNVKDRGFDGRGVLTARVAPKLDADFRQAQARMAGVFADLTQRVAALPGVDSVAAVSMMPFAGSGPGYSGMYVEGQPPPAEGGASVATVTPDYFRTMGIAIVAGRDFDARDTLAGEPVAIANMAFRQRFAPGRDIVGRRVMRGTPLRLVGVVQDVPAQSLRELPEPRLYLPLAQLPRSQVGWRSMTLVIRGPNDGPSAAMVREQIRAAGPGMLVDEVATMEERLAAALRAERDSAKVFGFFAVVAIILAGVGVYGVASYAVAQRTKEIGVRIALGAGRHDINRLVLTGALGPTLLGVGWGLLATVGVGPLLAAMLYGVAPLDPTTFVVSAITLVGVALGATYLPARRALRVDPVSALRMD